MSGPDGPLLKLVKDRRIAFLLVGAVNTAIGYFCFVAFLFLGQGRWHYLITLLMAHVVSVLCAFVLYRTLVFRVTGHVWMDLARFESVYLTSLAVNFLALPALVELAGWQPLVAQTVILFVTTAISYVGHSRWSFRRSPDRPS